MLAKTTIALATVVILSVASVAQAATKDKENHPGSVEAVLLDGLNDRGFAAGLGQGAGRGFFVEQAEVRSGKAAFLQKRFELGTEK